MIKHDSRTTSHFRALTLQTTKRILLAAILGAYRLMPNQSG